MGVVGLEVGVWVSRRMGVEEVVVYLLVFSLSLRLVWRELLPRVFLGLGWRSVGDGFFCIRWRGLLCSINLSFEKCSSV